MTTDTVTHWWDDRRALAMVAGYLIGELRASEVADMLDRPYNFDAEHAEAVALVNA